MTIFETIIAVTNGPMLAGILIWIIKVETRLTKIETICKLRNTVCENPACDAEEK